MARLVALALPPGRGFVDALRAAWDSGDAVLPVDLRLPDAARRGLLAALRPAVLVTAEGRHDLPGAAPVADGDAVVVPTSGTTGIPKGVVLTHAAVEASARATYARLDVRPDRDRWLSCLPLAHIGGLAVVMRALVTGTPLDVLAAFDPREVEDRARGGATLVSLVATALGRTDASGFRVVLLGGAAPPSDLPANVVTTYGMTESGSGVVYDGTPLDGVQVVVGDGHRGREGEILVRGPMLLRAYRVPATTAGDVTEVDPRAPDGWFATGDGGAFDATGRLHVHGRLAEVIVSGGEKVWPAPVEDALRQHPGVAEVAVWKRPDPEWGERVVAWVVPTDRSSVPGADELREQVRSALPPWCAPKEVVVVDDLPRTPSGKVRRAHLT